MARHFDSLSGEVGAFLAGVTGLASVPPSGDSVKEAGDPEVARSSLPIICLHG
jgi:hypothetical protein